MHAEMHFCFHIVAYLLTAQSVKPAETRCYTLTGIHAMPLSNVPLLHTNWVNSMWQDVFCMVRVMQQ
jgi:hypothetical protein